VVEAVVNSPLVRADGSTAVPEQQPSSPPLCPPRRRRGRAVLLALLTLLVTQACDGGNEGTSPSETSSLTGTYVGDYTVSAEPGTVYRAGLTLLQTGQNLRGQLTTDGLRTALVSLTINGPTVTGDLEYTDDCVGSAELTASIQADGDRIVGSYSATDCSGEYAGTFDLVRQTGPLSPPIVTITAPEDLSKYIGGTSITLEGSGTDPDGGNVGLLWRSSLRGVLGTGSPLQVDDLPTGEHTISLIGIDDEVQMRATAIAITIGDYLTGTFVGEYTVSTEPGTVYSAALVLSQAGRDVVGQLTTDAPRTGLVSFLFDDSTLTGELEFTDDCAGSANVTANIQSVGDRIVGSYSATDCSGSYTGTFDVVRHTGRLLTPTVTLDEPIDGSTYLVNTPITFRGTGSDPDGGTVTLVWRSNIDGVVGTGSPIYRDDLSVGAHAIELIGIDDEVQLATDTTHIMVVPIVEPSVSISLEFHGESSAETPDADDLDPAATFTIELWIKPARVTGADQHLVSKWGVVEDASYQVAIADGRLLCGTRNSAAGSNTFAVSNTQLDVDVWQHVAVVFDNGEVRLFVHGLLDSAQPGMHIPQATGQAVSLGREKSHNPNFYSGLMDEVRIWNVARTAAEIASDMTASLSGSEPGLVAYWPMNEGAGDTAFDLTGNGHDMRLGDSVGPDSADPTWVWADQQ
jgi:hypothetical protein